MELAIVIKRMEGKPSETLKYKKGMKFHSLEDAEYELWKWSLTAPPAPEEHKVAYTVTVDGSTYYGTFGISKSDPPTKRLTGLRDALRKEYGVIL